MFLGAAIGGFSGLAALLPLPLILHWLLLFFSGCLVCFAAFYNGSWIALVKSSVTFFTFSLIFSGLIALLTEIFGINAAVVGGRVYFNISPVLLLIFTVISYIASELFERIKGRKAPDSIFCRLHIEGNGEHTEVLAKIDTGNTLNEPFSGLPVVVISCRAIQKILPAAVSDYIKSGKFPTTSDGFRLVPFSTVSGNGLLPAFRSDCISVKGSEKCLNCYIAVLNGEISASGYSALINPEALDFI